MSQASTSGPSGPSVAGGSPASRTRGREDPAHDDDESTPDRTSVFVTENSVVVATPGFTRIENTELGRTHYGDPLPDPTRRALEVVAFYGR